MSPGSILESFMFDLSAGTTADIFIYTILAVLFLAVFEALRGRHSRFLNYAPSVMTSLGILGTFVGIVIGLLKFDTASIDASIPPLLAGLKTAFLTSLVGMSASIVFKIADVWIFARRRENQGKTEEVTPVDIHSVLLQQSKHLQNLHQALVGQEEGTLVGQLRLMRTDVNDNAKLVSKERREFSDRLWEEMNTFTEMLSKAATEQVIEALKQVILEFNQNLTEQFGENFKALDESVKKLVVWQEQYKSQIEVMSEQYEQSVESLVETKQSVSGIWEECKGIPLAMDKLKQVLEVNQHQIQELNRHLDAFVTMRDRAIEAVPQLQGQLDHIGTELKGRLEKIGEGMSEGTEAMRRTMLEGATEFGDSVRSTNASMTELATSITNEAEGITKTLDDTATQLNTTSRDMLERLEAGTRSLQEELDGAVKNILSEVRSSIDRSLNGLNDHAEQAVARTGEGVNRQVQILDEAVQQELQRVMSEMGRALTSITGQFADDYSRLVQAMGQVVREQP